MIVILVLRMYQFLKSDHFGSTSFFFDCTKDLNWRIAVFHSFILFCIFESMLLSVGNAFNHFFLKSYQTTSPFFQIVGDLLQGQYFSKLKFFKDAADTPRDLDWKAEKDFCISCGLRNYDVSGLLANGFHSIDGEFNHCSSSSSRGSAESGELITFY